VQNAEIGSDVVSVMNILLVIRRFDFGGAENHVCDLANGLTGKGHRVFFIDTQSEPPTAPEVISELASFLENGQYWNGQA